MVSTNLIDINNETLTYALSNKGFQKTSDNVVIEITEHTGLNQ